MATTYYKLVGTTNPHTNWTTEFIFRKKDGEVDKVVRLGEPVQLSAEERDTVQAAGLVLEQSSKSEADEVEEAKASEPVAGDDVRGSAPLFAGNVNVNVSASAEETKDSGSDSSEKK